MNGASIIEQARAEGLNLRLDGGRIAYRGNPEAVRHWLPRLRDRRAAILEALADREPTSRVVHHFVGASRRGRCVLRFTLSDHYGDPPKAGGGVFVGNGLTRGECEAVLRARYGNRLVWVWQE